jgi:hypothetical protein
MSYPNEEVNWSEPSPSVSVPWANTLDYYNVPKIMAKKGYIVQAPEGRMGPIYVLRLLFSKKLRYHQ